MNALSVLVPASPHRVLVAYGSKEGGTAAIAARMGDTMRGEGIGVDVLPASEVRDLDRYDAIVVGGALYMMRWHKDARAFVLRHAAALRTKPVWFFSSGPLDDSAEQKPIPPSPEVRQLMDFVGASEHTTFGGRLGSDAHGFLASRMARTHGGDWSNPGKIEAWARRTAAELDDAVKVARSPGERRWKPLPSRALPVALSLFAAVSAIFGGVCFVYKPDGSVLGTPLSMLQHSPFRDFLVPGLLLLVVVGFGNAATVVLHAKRSAVASFASFVSGSALVIFVVVEMILLRSAVPLQLGYALLGVAMVVEAMREVRAMLPTSAGSAPRPPSGVAHAGR